MTGTNKKLREALLSDMDIAVLRMPVHLAFAGNMAQFQYHNRVQALLDRIEALATPTAEQVDDINVAESFTSVTKTAAPAQGEPFGYFRAEPFGWTDCAATDDGAIALYERPAAHAVPQGEPVYQLARATGPVADAWIDVAKDVYDDAGFHPSDFKRRILYATPAAPSQPVTLTDEEIKRNWSGGACPPWGIKFARAIIAALRAKGGK